MIFQLIEEFFGRKSFRLNVDTQNAYIALGTPKLPVIHPYNPTGTTEANQREDTAGMPHYLVAANLGSYIPANLPSALSRLLDAEGVSADNVDVCFLIQNQPWKDEELLFRPHSWLDPDAPVSQEGYKRNFNDIIISTFEVGSDAQPLRSMHHIEVHQNEDDMVVFSADCLQIKNLKVTAGDVPDSKALCSFTYDPTSKKAIITFHWLLSDIDFEHVQQVVEQNEAQGFEEFLECIAKVPTPNEFLSINIETLMQLGLGHKLPEIRQKDNKFELAEISYQYHLLNQAICTEDLNEIDKLIKIHNLNPNAHTPGGTQWLPLHFAVSANKHTCVRRLCDLGAEINGADLNGWTSAHLAALEGKQDVLLELMNCGADILKPASDGKTALDVMINAKHFGIIEPINKLLLEKHEKSLLHFVAQTGNTETFIKLVEQGADFLSVDHDGKTPLDIALELGYMHICEALDDFFEENPLNGLKLSHILTQRAPINTLRAFAEKGFIHFDEPTVGGDEWRPIHFAASSQSVEKIRALVDAGANVEQPDRNGWTASKAVPEILSTIKFKL
ncbi:MAG: ankyrin repeat domain-containing protein [Francisellaceae bacterium]|nr:ankyrin repeat domain-containing protein [Francisellaceae bacterium]MBT6208370.1 ankyrin repeat domain-containing protein [Francisellaceae bacterium]MBT6537967.1 ankyrin repeat domain-containing protein [Francisellaceae bacterium]